MKTRKRIKKLVITAGILALALFAPSNHSNPLGQYQSTITAYAAETLPYSSNWETQSDGSWKYKLNSGQYASGWIQDEVDKNWYYLESTVMQSGIYKSYGRFFLLYCRVFVDRIVLIYSICQYKNNNIFINIIICLLLCNS